MGGIKIVKFLSAVLLSAALLATGAIADETIKIGYGGALNGEVASYGLSGLRGMEFAVEKINSQGGIHGKKVEILKEDDSCDPSLGTSAASKLQSSGVKIVMGHTCSGATISALGVYGDNMIVISPSATDVSITSSGKHKNFFRTIARDDAQSKVQADAIINLGVKKVALLHDKGEYGLSLTGMAKTILEAAGVEVVLFEGITPGQLDYGPVINKIKRSKASAVLFGGYYPEGSKIVSQMGKSNLKLHFIGADGIRDATFVKVAGEYAEGVFSTGPVDNSQNSLAIEALKWNDENYGNDPGMYLFTGAAATFVALGALEKAGLDASVEDLRKIIQTESFDTPLGSISFDEFGDTLGEGFILYQVKDGVFRPMQ